MIHLGFWLIWMRVGYVGANAWLGTACPSGGYNFLLVLLQLPQLALPMSIWLIAGIAISVVIAVRTATPAVMPSPPARRVVSNNDHSPASVPSASDIDLMGQFNISFDGRRYEFDGRRYDSLSDAVGYAKLIAGRGNA